MSSSKMFRTKYFENLATNMNILITKCADLIVIVARTQKKLTQVYLDLEEETSKLGMEINENKTKYMVTSNILQSQCFQTANGKINNAELSAITSTGFST